MDPSACPTNPRVVLHRGGASGRRRRHINLFFLNPLGLARHWALWGRHVSLTDINVLTPFWELPLLPKAWAPVMRAMDIVLAPSRFIERACLSTVSPDAVLYYPQAAFVPDEVRSEPEKWGLPDEATSFIVAFDPGSDIDRKNPTAAIMAFQRAFPANEKVALVIKTQSPRTELQAGLLDRIRREVSGDARITWIQKTLLFQELLGLYASCDVLLSLHRSEGLGLHLMEAMSLGRATVATGWSGNLDFMSSANSFPVPYELVQLATRQPEYLAEIPRQGQVWAEPSIGSAAAICKRLADNRVLRDDVGARAAQSMRELRARVLTGQTFDQLEARLSRQTSARRLAPALVKLSVTQFPRVAIRKASRGVVGVLHQGY